MAKKRYYEAKKGSGMMSSGAGQFANMPQASFVKYFPKNAYMTTGVYPDYLAAIDKQMNGDVNKAKKNQSKTKF